jgi:hypothetical protein
MNDYGKGVELHARLNECAAACLNGLSGRFRDELCVLIQYEKMVYRATVILGSVPPKDIPDRSVRDLLVDCFDSLYAARRLALEGYQAAAAPLLRRAHEAVALLSYFAVLPNKAIEWDRGRQIPVKEIGKYLNSRSEGEPGTFEKKHWGLYSKSTHVNREAVAFRNLGEGKDFVLGAALGADLRVAADEMCMLMRLWFWLEDTVYRHYEELLVSIDSQYRQDHSELQKKARSVHKELLRSCQELFETKEP